MKKLALFLGIFLMSLSSFAQLSIVQSAVTPSPYKVGDTLTIKYTITKGTTTPRYFWLRYQYDNKALSYVSTTFTQGTSVQTYYTGWNNYAFTPSSSAAETQLYAQYLASPWAYTANPNYNVGQLTVQRTDASIDGILATQKYIIKDKGVYDNIHKMDIAYSIDAAGVYISPVTRLDTNLSLSNISGNTSQFKVKVLFPQGYPINDHRVQLMKLKSDGSGDIDWTQRPIAELPLDATGEATFTSGVKVGDELGVFVAPAMTKTWMNDIVTVSDAYKAFLGHTQTDISGAATFFTYPALEKKVGLVTLGGTNFGESDSYNLFAHVMGMDVSTKANIATSTAASVRWYSGLLNQSWLDGVVKNKVSVTAPNQTVNAVFAWGGDLNWSHSTSPDQIAANIASGIYTNSVSKNTNLSTNSVQGSALRTMAYTEAPFENAKLSVTSKLENGKVILTTTLSKEGLAGLQVIMNYDNTRLTLDNVIFNAGSTITNFSTHKDNRLTFGSIDQMKTARIKVGTPYTLIFTPKEVLSNTAGLFYFILSDAVDGNGKKINLVVE